MTETVDAPVEAMSKSSVQLKQEADKITNRRTLYAAGAGLLPFPIIDIAAILGVQVVMIRDIANVYGADFKEDIARSIITTLVGDLGTLGVMSGVKALPIVGSFIGGFTGALTGAAATYALGKVFTQHFDQGGTLLSFDPVKSRQFFQEAYEEGKLFVEDLNESETEANEKSGWRSWFGGKKEKAESVTDASGELASLRQSNSEMKTMLAELQKSVASLKKG